MTTARRETVIPGEEAVYHCRSRCVRRAFLFGLDLSTNKNFKFRKAWIKERLKFLATVFAIEPIAFALMDNHIHVLLRTSLLNLSDEEVARRWLRLYPRKSFNRPGGEPDKDEISAIVSNQDRVSVLRQRLANISWFMKSLNEYIARRANKEDQCTGRFWESRFKCQRLDSEAAVLTCAAYVDLNPVRAAMTPTPEASSDTSFWDRVTARSARERLKAFEKGELTIAPSELNRLHEESKLDLWLAPIQSDGRRPGISEMTLDEYLTLVDWTGREIRSDKRGAIPGDIAPILQRLSINPGRWVAAANNFGTMFCRIISDASNMSQTAKNSGKKWLRGMGQARRLFGCPSPLSS